MKTHYYLALLAGVSTLASGIAHAQNTPVQPQKSSNDVTEPSPATDQPIAPSPKPVSPAQTPPPPPSQAGSAAGQIIITGSRVITNGNNSPTPVTVLNTDQISKLQPTTLTEQISDLVPALQGSQNVQSRPGGGQRNGAGAYLNLRNMGDLRTLVLFDGLRLVPTINQNEADTDASIVPQMLIKRVDVVTGGVSAVYGSDAISGVVNFITDRSFNGVKVQGSGSFDKKGNDQTWDIGVAAGTPVLGGRGHIEFSVEHHYDPGIQTRLADDQSYFAANIGQAGAGTAANPYFNIPDMRLSNTTFGGLISSSSNAADTAILKNLMFTPSGSLTPFVHGSIPLAGGTLAPFGTPGTLASSNVESGGSGAWFPTSSIKAGIRFNQAFGRFDYDVTDDIHAFVQFSYSDIKTFDNFRSPVFTNFKVSYANPFLLNTQQPYQSLFLNNPTRTLTFSEVLENDPTAEQYTRAYEAYAGLEGHLFGNLKWNVNVGQSQSTITAYDINDIDRGKLFAALDAVDQGLVTTGVRNGNIVCRAGVAYTGHAANPAYANCVPLNLFGGNPTPSQLAYLYDTTWNKNRTRLFDLNGSITGAPFSTWAGPVNMALSGEWRSLNYVGTSDTNPAAFANCAGIAYNCTSSTLQWFDTTMAPVAPVTQKVGEVAYEVDVPLLKDVPLVEALDVTGAVRYTHYNTSGNATTWKVGADWHISPDFKLRATRSRDIRAPNLFELYTSQQINSGITATDPLTGGTLMGPFPNTQGGNPNLKPEKADTLTVGGIFTPRFIPRFSLSVDYYKIDVKDVIFLLQGWSAQVLAICDATQGANPSCALVNRPSWTDTNPVTNPIISTTSTYLNIAAQHTWGIDTEANYRFNIDGHGLSLRALASYQPKLVYDQGPAGLLSVAGAFNAGSNRIDAAPKWRVVGLASFDVTKNFNVTLAERWRSQMNAIYDATKVLLQPKIPSIGYTTVNLSYNVQHGHSATEIYFNVANVFNKFPTVYYSGQITQPGTQPYLPEGDDVVGRYYTVGLRQKF